MGPRYDSGGDGSSPAGRRKRRRTAVVACILLSAYYSHDASSFQSGNGTNRPANIAAAYIPPFSRRPHLPSHRLSALSPAFQRRRMWSGRAPTTNSSSRSVMHHVLRMVETEASAAIAPAKVEGPDKSHMPPGDELRDEEKQMDRTEAPEIDEHIIAAARSSLSISREQQQHQEKDQQHREDEEQQQQQQLTRKEEMKQQLAELLEGKRERDRTQTSLAATAENTYLKVLMGVGSPPPKSPPQTTATTPSNAGLSKYHQRLLTSTIDRQRFVTGRYPLYVTVRENPTRKWLGQVGSKRLAATSEVLINGTSIDRSLASYDRFQWLDDEEIQREDDEYDIFSVELLAEIHVRKPGYVNILAGDGAGSSGAAIRELKEQYKGWNRWRFHADNPFHERWWMDERESDRLWITGFSLTKTAGELNFVDVDTGRIGTVNKRTAKAIRWPNEVNSVPLQRASLAGDLKESGASVGVVREEDDALLVSDGFLVPGRDRGGLYIVRNPGNEDSEWRVCLTGGDENRLNPEDDGWFYHRAIWTDLTGDGYDDILTARAKIPSILSASSGGSSQDGRTLGARGQLVWLERPKPHSYDKSTGTPLDEENCVFDPFSTLNTPWKVRVLEEGPDVMFSVADLDATDDTIEVIASQFFSRKLSVHSIRIGDEPSVSFSRIIDEKCGASFSSILANLDGNKTPKTQVVVDSGSTVTTLQPGDPFSHLLITNHECESIEDSTPSSSDSSINSSNGSDNAHTVVGDGVRYNTGSSSSNGHNAINGGSLFAYRVPSGKDAWKKEPWIRSVIATGFRVRGQLSNMINPGAPGFCYTFYPTTEQNEQRHLRPLIGIAGDCAEAAYILRPAGTGKSDGSESIDHSTNYSLMCEIETGATCGSLGIGFDDFVNAEQQSGYAKIYVPCYEQNKILVFALGDKKYHHEDVDEDNDGW